MTLPFITLATTGSATPYQIPVFPTLPQGWEITKTPKWPGRDMRSVSGLEWRATDQTAPRYEWELTYPLLRDGSYAKHMGGTGDGYDEFHDLAGFFNLFSGGFSSFLYDDPTDDTVVGQVIGTGNGSKVTFQLVRTIGGSLAGGGWTDIVNAINVVSTIYLNGTPTSAANYSVGFLTGLVKFNSPPGNGVVITADFTYYWNVRFIQDSMNFENFLLQLWQNKAVKFISVLAPVTFPPPPMGITIPGQGTSPPTGLGTANSVTVINGTAQPGQITITTTNPNDIIVLRICIYGYNYMGGVPSVVSVAATGLTWANRTTVSGARGTHAGMPTSIDCETWWAFAPVVGTYIINVAVNAGLSYLVMTAFTASDINTSSPWDPGAPSNASNLAGITSTLPQATITTTHAKDLIFFQLDVFDYLGTLGSVTPGYGPVVGGGAGDAFSVDISSNTYASVVYSTQAGVTVGLVSQVFSEWVITVDALKGI